jgi:hypothetical protein
LFLGVSVAQQKARTLRVVAREAAEICDITHGSNSCATDRAARFGATARHSGDTPWRLINRMGEPPGN